MTDWKNLFLSKAWHTLVPDWSHTLLTVGYGTLGAADYAGCAMDAGGTLAIIYMPSNRTMTVDMSKFSGVVTCRWYDPPMGVMRRMQPARTPTQARMISAMPPRTATAMQIGFWYWKFNDKTHG